MPAKSEADGIHIHMKLDLDGVTPIGFQDYGMLEPDSWTSSRAR